MTARSAALTTAVLACLLAGCADGGLTSGLNTGSINSSAETKTAAKSTEALCLTLASQIEGLNSEGVSEKVSKAAAKKYKLKSTDLAKADELNKANTEFQTKCSSYPPRVAAATPVEPAATTTTAAATTGAAKTAAKPPVPAQKPVAAAMLPQATDATKADGPFQTP